MSDRNQQSDGQQAVFVTGPTMRHVVVMTVTGSVGLVAIFAVDALNLFYISLLGVHELAAAVGFAGTLMFFTLSVSIGLTIATSALTARALGRGSRDDAARMGGASMVLMGAVSLTLTVLIWPFINPLLALLGAEGETLALATRFLRIVIPSIPIIALGMCASGILRGAGDARRAMYITLAGGVAAAILDPLLIFGFGLGLDGAAISTVLSRFFLLFAGLYGARTVHQLMRMPNLSGLRACARPFFAIGIPAVLTQIATPVGNAYVTAQIASFGDDAVAGWAIVGRIMPVAFGVIFALSGAVGPILGQNFGARRFERLTSTMRDSLVFTLLYVCAVWGLLAVFRHGIADLFNAEGETRELIEFFCLVVAGSFLFNGALFVANAAFNNLGYPTLSTMFNWGRSTLGVIPFVWIGAAWYGPQGALGGWGLGAIIFGVAAIITCFRVIRKIADREPPDDGFALAPPPAAQSPFSSGKASTAS